MRTFPRLCHTTLLNFACATYSLLFNIVSIKLFAAQLHVCKYFLTLPTDVESLSGAAIVIILNCRGAKNREITSVVVAAPVVLIKLTRAAFHLHPRKYFTGSKMFAENVGNGSTQ